ncbi:MAG: aldose 1-epimerase [Planktomarina sp.]|nr:aldose 1-epimerase [Planktomarina sp.]
MLVMENDFVIVEINSEVGGSISRFYYKHKGEHLPVLRAATGTDSPVEMSMFPLVPYCNRIKNNEFEVDGKFYNLKPNFGQEPHACHGDGWISSWNISKATTESVQLRLAVDEPDNPYKYEAELEYKLADNALIVNLAVKNLSENRLPYGLGIHPYFLVDGSQLQFDAKSVVLEGPEHLPTETISLPPELAFTNYSKLPKVWRNLCYADWSGLASVKRGGLLTQLKSKTPYLMLFTPPGENYFCIEPMSHNIGAINNENTGLGEGVVFLNYCEFMVASYKFEMSML